MPRRRRRRKIGFNPNFIRFGPKGEGPKEEIILNLDEFEAIRLKDNKDLSQDEAAEKMDISQPTFHRTLVSARRKIAEALTEGKDLRIRRNADDSPRKGRGRRKRGKAR